MVPNASRSWAGVMIPAWCAPWNGIICGVSPPPDGSVADRVKYPVRPPATAPAPNSPAPVSSRRRDGPPPASSGPAGSSAGSTRTGSATGPLSRDAMGFSFPADRDQLLTWADIFDMASARAFTAAESCRRSVLLTVVYST